MAAAGLIFFLSADAKAQIGGLRSLCEGTTIVLSDPVMGGLWSSDNPAVATIDPMTAMVTGVSPGTAVISYMSDTVHITVTALHSLMGDSITVCAGDTVMLTDPLITSSIHWQLSNGWPHSLLTTPPYIDAATGLFTATTLDTGNIWVSGIDGIGLASCGILNISVTDVPPVPATIAGPSVVNVAATIHLSDPTPGGTWHSSTPGIATVDGSGNVYGVSAGTDTIFYRLSNTCGNASVYYLVTVTGTTSIIQQPLPNNRIVVFPNPADAILYIKGEDLGQYQVTDETGRTVLTGELTGNVAAIAVSGLHPGIYFLTSTTAASIHRQTILITR